MIVKRRIWHILLTALLLIAQHAALAHQVYHLHDGLPVESHYHSDGKQDPHSDSCKFHVAFDEVLGAVSSFALPPPTPANTVERSVTLFPDTFPTDLIVPASRGPPVLL